MLNIFITYLFIYKKWKKIKLLKFNKFKKIKFHNNINLSKDMEYKKQDLNLALFNKLNNQLKIQLYLKNNHQNISNNH